MGYHHVSYQSLPSNHHVDYSAFQVPPEMQVTPVSLIGHSLQSVMHAFLHPRGYLKCGIHSSLFPELLLFSHSPYPIPFLVSIQHILSPTLYPPFHMLPDMCKSISHIFTSTTASFTIFPCSIILPPTSHYVLSHTLPPPYHFNLISKLPPPSFAILHPSPLHLTPHSSSPCPISYPISSTSQLFLLSPSHLLLFMSLFFLPSHLIFIVPPLLHFLLHKINQTESLISLSLPPLPLPPTLSTYYHSIPLLSSLLLPSFLYPSFTSILLAITFPTAVSLIPTSSHNSK